MVIKCHSLVWCMQHAQILGKLGVHLGARAARQDHSKHNFDRDALLLDLNSLCCSNVVQIYLLNYFSHSASHPQQYKACSTKHLFICMWEV